MNFNSNTILFILVGLVALAVLAIGYYIYKTDFNGGKMIYNINKRLEIIEKQLYMDRLDETTATPREEVVVNREAFIQPPIVRREFDSPFEFLMRSTGMTTVNQESEEEITREIEQLKKQLETDSSSNKSETIEVISDTKSKLSDIREVSDESTSSVVVENSNASVATNGQTHNEILHEFEDLGDTDHIENSELDSYINNAAIENSEDIEKKLDEMSNSSQVDTDVQYNVRIELIANSSKLKDIKELCKKNGIAIGSSSKTELVRKLYKINPDIYDLLVTNKENYTKENSNLN